MSHDDPGRVEAAGPERGAEPPAWRAGIDNDRRRHRRRPDDQRATLWRLTVSAAVAAVGLNALLFAQTGIGQVGPGALGAAIVSAVNALFPGVGLKIPSHAPSPAPVASPIAVTGAS